jgi:hypothetical protein
MDEIRDLGADVVVVGNGNLDFAQAFREDLDFDGPLLIDPELEAYRAASLRRGHKEILSPRMPLNALRSMRKGFRQTSVQGDAFQLGGVFVIQTGGELAYRYASREAGDHPPIEDVLDAIVADPAEFEVG